MHVLIQSITPPVMPPGKTQRLLEAAQTKLLAAHVPLLLRLTAFLRLSCATLECPGAYSNLMKALFNHDPEWWRTCDITPMGTIHSSDPKVQKLLVGILRLHSTQEQ